MIRPNSLQHCRKRPVREQNSDLFDGPTLIQVAPQMRQNAFIGIHRSIQPESIYYPLYIECKAFAMRAYERRYGDESYVSNMAVVEPQDKHSVIVYSLNSSGRVDGTLRLCSDSGLGLPMANDVPDIITTFRRQDLRVAEPGRFANDSATSHRLVAAAFEIACYSGIDIYLMQCRAEHQDFYKSRLAAELLEGYPAPEHCVNMIWRIAETPHLFFQRFGSHRESLEALLSSSENHNE